MVFPISTFDPLRPRGYRAPLALNAKGEPNNDTILGWLREAINEGETALRGQSAYGEIDQAVEFTLGMQPDKLPKHLSRIKIPHAKRDLREMCEILSNLRFSWTFDYLNPAYERQASIANKTHKAWYVDTFVDRKIYEALIWAGTCGTGYISPFWNPTYHKDTGWGEVDLRVFGPKDFLPVQIPRDGNIQGCYAGIIHEEMTEHEINERFPLQAPFVTYNRSIRSGLGSRMLDQARTVLSFVLGQSNYKRNRFDVTPITDVYYCYVDDTTANNTGSPIAMGTPGSSWHYIVPSYQSDIPSGQSAEGRQLFRKASEQDARLYPGKRLIIATDNVILYDGPSYFWHGQIPIVKFALVQWPWEPILGHSIMKDAWSIQASLTSHYRAIDDKANAGLRPPLVFDENRVSKQSSDGFDPRQPGQKLRGDLSAGKLVEPVLDPSFYQIPQWLVAQYLPFLREQVKEQIGLPGLEDAFKLRQMPASESLDKLAELSSPLAQGMSRSMEKPIKELGDMTNSMRSQFYTQTRRLKLLGEDGLTEEDFDYEPGTLVPSHLPEEDPSKPSFYSLYQRGRWFSSQIRMHVTPLSLHQMTQTSRKLMYLQLWRSGFPIDPLTVAEALDLPAWGQIKGDTMLERWISYQMIQLQLKIQQQQQVMGAMGGEPTAGGAGAESGSGGGPSGAPSMEGRPPSGNAPPHQEVKADGRPTIAES